MSKRLLASTALAAVIAVTCGSAFAQSTTVKVLRNETNEVEKQINSTAEADYEKAHPGVDVQFEYIANEAYKQKLPTLLQSDARPDFFYSWGGEVLRDHYKAGFLRPVGDAVAEDWKKTFSKTALSAFTIDGKVVGAPINAGEVVFWKNQTLAKKAGVDVSAIRTWDDFLSAVKKAKDAGVTPIMLGGMDKWPVHFYYGYLALREAGEKGFEDAKSGEGDGFAAAPFVKAGVDFKKLVDLQPFQPGFMSTTYEQASGRFGDGQALFHLMGDWDYQGAKDRSLTGKGFPDDQLGLLRFPAVQGGAGDPSDTFGAINGWAVAKGASDQAIDFLTFLNGSKYQAMAAEKGAYIPTATAALSAIDNPYFKTMAQDLKQAKFHQIFLDQDLGADVGATFNDASADLAQGAVTPEEAAQSIQDAWSFR